MLMKSTEPTPISRHPYAGRMAVLATKHGKEQQIARPLHAAIGLKVCVPPTIDTDRLGTFTGEVPRPGTPAEVVLQKALLGMELTGLPLGLANEGSFGPHPALPLLIVDTELLLFVDEERGIQVREHLVSERVVAVQTTARSLTDLEDFLVRARFPSHGLIVRPNVRGSNDPIVKGITDSETLAKALTRCASHSSDGYALVESDLRAHMNPTRRGVLRQLAIQLARRLSHLCPRCDTPGWGLVAVVRDLPCEWCGTPTDLVSEEIIGCPSCPYQERVPRADGLRHASPGACARCNP